LMQRSGAPSWRPHSCWPRGARAPAGDPSSTRAVCLASHASAGFRRPPPRRMRLRQSVLTHTAPHDTCTPCAQRTG
jgi:hypothetical protein